MRAINIKQKMKCGAILALSLLSFQAFALQIVDVNDQRSHVVNISKNELTRIALQGAGKLLRLDYVEGELDVSQDAEAGDVRIMPLVDKPINVFARTSNGQTHALIMQPKDIPIETILLKEGAGRAGVAAGGKAGAGKAGTMEQAVKKLVTAMAKAEEGGEFDVVKVNKEIGLWNEARFVLHERYVGRSLIGERFRLTNVSPNVMRLAEQELYKRGVIAVSIESQVLNPGESTEIFIAKVNNDG